jgi:hypothetical protein
VEGAVKFNFERELAHRLINLLLRIGLHRL